MLNSTNNPHPHMALLTSSGVGHLTPFLRLAASLVHHDCQITLITCHPILSLAESELISNFLSAFPQVEEKKLRLLPPDLNHMNSNNDPFLLQWDAARRSVLHLLPPLLSSLSSSPSALISDVTLLSSVISVTENSNLPVYILFPSCARMFSLLAYYPKACEPSRTSDVIEIPGVMPMPKSSIPPLLLNPKSIFASIFKEDGEKITKVTGTLINTFDRLESHTLEALQNGKVIDGLPPVFTVPLMPCEFERGTKKNSNAAMEWLDDQSPGSVVYVSFGSKAAMSRVQIKEIGEGLVRSGYPFLWVVKDKEVDKEDSESLNDVLGDELIGKIKDKGFVVKEFVNQGEILGHKAIGGFFTHCGWNSVVESAWRGVRLLAWPPKGDQRVNAEAMELSGLGMWPRSWGWAAEMVVKGEELGEKIKEMMGSEELRLQAAEIKEEAGKAVGAGGSCEKVLKELIEKWKNKN